MCTGLAFEFEEFWCVCTGTASEWRSFDVWCQLTFTRVDLGNFCECAMVAWVWFRFHMRDERGPIPAGAHL